MKKYRSFLIIIIFTMFFQAISYFLIKSFISNYHIINSIINVSLIKSFIYFYDLWYPFIFFITFIIFKHDKKLFSLLITTMIITTIMAHLTFIIYPSMIIRPDISVNNFTTWLIDFTYKTDTPAVNCLPSMHCIYCFIIMFYTVKCKNINSKKTILILLFSILIILSTLFIKQHVLEDVLLSLTYTVIAIIIVYLNKNRITKLFDKII